MTIAVIANEVQQVEVKQLWNHKPISYYTSINDVINDYDVIFDFLYKHTPIHNNMLCSKGTILFINEIIACNIAIPNTCIRFNGWNTFYNKLPLEIALINDTDSIYKKVLDYLNITYILVPNTIGLVTPKVVSMLINEAYFALQENVSTKKEIDMAMQLGTSYPFGPFEWANKIGIMNIKALLTYLSQYEERYTIADALKNEVA